MKLKTLLVGAFLVLTLSPIIIALLLLTKSGYDLSKESYTRNLIESITVQTDYISQAIENNMIADYRFANRNRELFDQANSATRFQHSGLLSAFQQYLATAEDRVTTCMLLNKDNVPFYSIGEKKVQDEILAQLSNISSLTTQQILEFTLKNVGATLGIVTPIHEQDGSYVGSFVSVYNKYHIFKIISSYYKITDSSTYICREDGDIVTFKKFANEEQNIAIKDALDALTLSSRGVIDMGIGEASVLGYYQKINNTPWYLVGFVDESLIFAFAGQFLWMYIFIIIAVGLGGGVLALYVSHRVVKPINELIKVMDDYQNNVSKIIPDKPKGHNYFEIQYLWSTFSTLMRTIMLVQHNFEGIYHLYQSNNMGDINIDIDVKKQTVVSNKDIFQTLMHEISVPKEACIVERFVNCFCSEDRKKLMEILENMRDKHLSVACEAELYTPYLNQRWFHSLVVPLYEDDRLSRFFVQLRDISNFKQQEFQSNEKARRDPLTGLYNRSGFCEGVKMTLNENLSAQQALLFIDMDSFKLVNDTLGHHEGDTLLQAVGDTLLEVVGEHGLASRFGGDEFAVFLPDTSPEQLQTLLQTLHTRLIYPFVTPETSFTVTASIGVAVRAPGSAETLEALLERADADMYQTKKSFKAHERRQTHRPN